MANSIFLGARGVAIVLVLMAAASFASAESESDTIGQMRERIGRLEMEQARLQQENQTMLTQLTVLETRKKLKVAQQDEGVGVLPLIVALSRMDEAWSVRLQGADGVISSFAVGDIPQKGVRIVDISASGVKVEIGQGKQAQKLALAYTGATQQTGAPGGPMSGMPMPMPLPGSLATGARSPSQPQAR